MKPKGLEQANVIGARLPGDEHRPAATDDSVPRCSVVLDPSPRAAAAISVGLSGSFAVSRSCLVCHLISPSTLRVLTYEVPHVSTAFTLVHHALWAGGIAASSLPPAFSGVAFMCGGVPRCASISSHFLFLDSGSALHRSVLTPHPVTNDRSWCVGLWHLIPQKPLADQDGWLFMMLRTSSRDPGCLKVRNDNTHDSPMRSG